MFNLIENKLNKSITENGAVGYHTTKSALLDLNYQVSSLRNTPEEEIKLLFTLAFMENREYAMKWLFFARDIRGGLGDTLPSPENINIAEKSTISGSSAEGVLN